MTEQEKMIQQFQCPGCTCGSWDNCDNYQYDKPLGFRCKGHSAGTFMAPGGRIALGLPKGFDKVGTIKTGFEDNKNPRSTNIRMFLSGSPDWNHLNVPVWAMEKDGYLFVRTYCPRINTTYVDIIKDGKIKDLQPKPINVANFYNEID